MVFDVDISDEACQKCGFLHGETAIDPNDNKVEIAGVAPGNDGITNVLWYFFIHSRTKGKVCYWGGEFPDNLIKAGFVKKID